MALGRAIEVRLVVRVARARVSVAQPLQNVPARGRLQRGPPGQRSFHLRELVVQPPLPVGW